MKQDNFNMGQDGMNGNQKKKMNGADVTATVVSVVLIFLFGVLGALICYGGYWLVRTIAKSKMPLAARIILGTIVAIVFIALLVGFILFSAGIRADI